MTASSIPGEYGASPFRQLASIVRPWRAALAVVGLLVIAAAAFELLPPLLVRKIVDDHLTTLDKHGLLALALLYLAATAGVQGLTFAYGYLAAVIAQGALNSLRVRLFSHLQELPVAYYDRTPLGDSISRCTADVETIDTLFSSGVATLVANLARVFTVAMTMVALSPPLALVSALVLPPLVGVTRFFQVRVRDAERANRLAVGRLNSELQESLGGVETIHAYGREASFVRRFRLAIRQTLLAYNRSAVYSALYTPTTAVLSALVTALLLWVGTRHAFASWGISVGTLTAFVILFQRFFKPITELGDQWQTVQSALSGAERIFQVLAVPPEANATRRRRAPRPGAALVVLQDVVFGYVEGRQVVRGVSLTVGPGEQVALVGRTGAGKSSIVHLIAGLYGPWAGSISVAGVDPRSLADEERRRVVGVVPQAVQLFSGSVFDNLTLGDGSVGLPAVRRAAQIAGIDALIASLPGGYDAPLSGSGRSGGHQLSAGQSQLLALARALVWGPRVILLDEATAAVDAASDAAFRTALRERVQATGVAVLTVAHRLATAREADRVIVMDAGRIVEEGTPAELVRRAGRFAALLELEAAGWDWRSAN